MRLLTRFFGPPPLADVINNDINSTERALHDAKLRLDRETATVNMLQTMLDRLKAEQNANK